MIPVLAPVHPTLLFHYSFPCPFHSLDYPSGRICLTLQYTRESESLLRCWDMIWEILIEYFTVYKRNYINMSFFYLLRECKEE